MKRKTLVLSIALVAALPAAAGELRAIVPVIGSTRGAFNSNFKTELQLNNRSAQQIAGTLVFHPQGGGAEVPLPYELAPHATLYWADVMESFGASGLGSLDVITEGKGVPTIVARAFDDRGEQGTTGATVPAVPTEEVLTTDAGVTLILPSDRAHYRFNIGVRTLGEGATVSVSIYGENGILRKHLGERSWGANVFEQTTADLFAGETLLANDSMVFEVKHGSIVIYGTTTDNTTNDPSITIAQ